MIILVNTIAVLEKVRIIAIQVIIFFSINFVRGIKKNENA